MDKAESSRRNGAKSHGPSSLSGKQISSRNSLKFGLYAKRSLALCTEDQTALDDLRERYYDEWRPMDQRQLDTVDVIVDSQWRALRFAATENWLVEKTMHDMIKEVDSMFPGGDPVPHDVRVALAYQQLYGKDNTIQNFQRERQRLSRTIERYTRLLIELQELNPPPPYEDDIPEEQKCKNEPTLPIHGEQKCANEPTVPIVEDDQNYKNEHAVDEKCENEPEPEILPPLGRVS